MNAKAAEHKYIRYIAHFGREYPLRVVVPALVVERTDSRVDDSVIEVRAFIARDATHPTVFIVSFQPEADAMTIDHRLVRASAFTLTFATVMMWRLEEQDHLFDPEVAVTGNEWE